MIHEREDNKQEGEEEEDAQECRMILPALKPPDQKVSVWKVIKDAVGKDLSRFCVPVYFNEPISMLQKVSEIMEYEQLLVNACRPENAQNSIKRILYVSSFAIAQYKCSDHRTNKPFNPILGETFEFLTPQFKYFSEQVCHHPPISACYANSDCYEFWMNTNMKTQFWGKSLEVKPLGYQHVRLHVPMPDGSKKVEHYIVERVSSSVNNLIFGEMYVEHTGVMTVKNLSNGDTCQVEFKKRGWSGKGAYEVEGSAFNAANPSVKQAKIWGKWTETLSIQFQGQPEELIWTANPLPPQSASMYHFTYFTLQLNFLPPQLVNKLPPTDSRLRPDQRALECGDLVKASDEKARLEDKQRKMRKERETQGREYQSKYFEEYFDEESGEKGYRYGIRDYWQDRNKGEFSHLEEIF
ncbi:hypothetical protein FGO68_gene15187 [Halteria grandinella]|uniref:Oxysterol-binding protein n=1 Tax=Halteria grandinella TaxID=5974 RepID=A0A8J8NAB8_HALGN|nr:hypothetical protein FGO68_gene15187 [Halteria grandinella]